MEDAVSRTEVRRKLYQLKARTQQWKQGPFKAGFNEAVNYVLSDLEGCRTLEGVTVTRCRDCVHATERQSTLPYCTLHNRTRNPEDYCNLGQPEE